jgi:hypothetical protein
MAFYFDNDIPKVKENVADYPAEYAAYSTNVLSGNYTKQSTSAVTKSFFNSVVDPNYKELQKLCELIKKEIENNKDSDGTITVRIEASCSAPATSSYNKELATRRINAAIRFFSTNFNTAQYYNNKLLVVSGTAFGEEASVLQYDEQKKDFTKGTTVSCTDNDPQAKGGDTKAASKEIYTTTAMACRRAYIAGIKSTLTQPPAQASSSVTQQNPQPQLSNVLVGTVTPVTTTVQTIEEKFVERDNITKRVLRSLLSECNYFEAIKEETPMVYDNLKDKLKFFQPAFHSITPEGLNSRLTFLQQCMRPGDTIPTIKNVNGTTAPDYSNATNTSFGAPPVLILRVGDFYNTKIIPTSLGITYENLDINPEGIGVQPMIANVTLAFNFVGGSGLKESVDKLQNALTFNYYANTEIYDDRADTTDLSYQVIDADFLKTIGSNVQPPTINQAPVQNGQSNDKPIGTVTSNVISQTGQTGSINYSTFMDMVVLQTQSYFTNVVNKNRETLNQYNNAVRQQWMMERTYTDGSFLITKNKKDNTVLFGKPYNLEKRTDEIFGQLEKDIKDGNEGFIQFISDTSKIFSNRLVNQVKENYSNYVKNKRSSFQNAITNITNGMVGAQQNYMGYLGRVNTITYSAVTNSGTDGYQQKNGAVISYNIYPTTEVDASSTGASNTLTEIENDVIKINSGITEFNTIVETSSPFTYRVNNESYSGVLVFPQPYKFSTEQVFVPFSRNQKYTQLSSGATFDNYIFRRVYMVVSDDVTDSKKYESFKNAIIGNVDGNTGLIGKGADNINQVFEAYWNVIAKPLFVEENDITKEFITHMEKDRLKDFLKYTPFSLKKKRTFTYDTENANTPAQQSLIKGLGATGNQNTNNKTWNDESPANVFICKAKLN